MFFDVEPFRIDPGGVHVYTSTQIDLYGLPYLWGINDYYVITTKESLSPLATDWKFEQSRWGSLRPIHRYNRVKRFEYILFQLIGERGAVDQKIILDIQYAGYNKDPRYVWESIRMLLKAKGLRQYYNRIPTIIQRLGLPYRINVQDPRAIVEDFKALHYAFDHTSLERKYFPNLRFICFKMLERHGAEFGFHVPLIRTPRKLQPLQDLWFHLLDSLPNKNK